MQALAVFVLVAAVATAAGGRSPDCGECQTYLCPEDCEYRVADPCGCCSEGLCAPSEGEPCSPTKPCGEEYYCDNSISGGVCTCKQDTRPVCGYDSHTYRSICDLNMKSKSGLRKWGVCDMPPRIISPPTDLRIELGQPLALDCEAKGSPVPSIMWQFVGKNGQAKILPSDDQMTAIQVRGGPENMMITSWVQIVIARESDQGLYTCIASNIYGEDKAQALVLKRKN